MKKNKPKFIIKSNLQKSSTTGIYFRDLMTKEVLDDVCLKITGKSDYEVMFVDNNYEDEYLENTYNKGRLAILINDSVVNYISFSDEHCSGRNSGTQSVPTAYNIFYNSPAERKKLYYYFLACSGNNATDYYKLMYRLMKTVGFNFLNNSREHNDMIIEQFNSLDDILRARRENNIHNPGNVPTYIEKTDHNSYEIYGKTYGANKYDTTMICYAMSCLANENSKITLYEYNENDLKELPKSCLDVISSMNIIEVINIDDEIEQKEMEENDSIRSPKFNIHLLERLGEKHCVLCECCVNEIIQGAHIYPVSKIKKLPISIKEKLEYATDGENGLWMCSNHHKLFDSDIILLSNSGRISYKNDLSDKEREYINSVTTINQLPPNLITDKYSTYINKRYAIS